MNPLKPILLLLLFPVSMAYAHQDFWTRKTFGNVKVRILTGFGYEEINKVMIIGQLAQGLCKNLSYTDTVFLDFAHYYVGNCQPDYFISFDKGGIKERYMVEEPYLKKKAIVIREVAHRFDAEATLKLVEYAIANLSLIQRQQRPLEYHKNYNDWSIYSIDTATVRKVTLQRPSHKVQQSLAKRVDGDKNDSWGFFSYYFQHGKYHVYYRDYDQKDSVMLVLNNIYQFKDLSFGAATVFDTDSTFYCVAVRHALVGGSRRMAIKCGERDFRPYTIEPIGSRKVAISFMNYGVESKERTLIYRFDKGELIDDIDQVFDDRRNTLQQTFWWEKQ